MNARRGDHAEHRPFGGEASIKEEARAEWAGQLGLSLDDIRALQEISQRFTAAYNAAYGTDLSQQAGRSILLKLSRADQLGERISTESKRRQEVLRTHDLTRLDRDSRLIPVDTFLSGLNARDRAVWDEIPQNGAFVESNTDEELHMYRKTASGDCVRTRLLPRIEPLFIAGFPCLSANDICSSLDRDSGLRVLFSPSCPYANNTFHDYSELTRLFRSIERITTAS